MGVWMRVPALAEALAGEDAGDVRAGQEALELVEALGIRGGRRVTLAEFKALPASRQFSATNTAASQRGDYDRATVFVALPVPEPSGSVDPVAVGRLLGALLDIAGDQWDVHPREVAQRALRMWQERS